MTPAKRKRTRSATAKPLPSTPKQLGGVTGKGFLPGQSGNPAGRPLGERKLLQQKFGDSGEVLYERLERLRMDRKTPRKLQAQIDMWLIERLHGKAPQKVEIGRVDLLELLGGRILPEHRDREGGTDGS